MKTIEELLYEYMKLYDVPDDVAQAAAHNCAQATAKQALVGGAAGYASGAAAIGVGIWTPPTAAAAISGTLLLTGIGAGAGAYHAIQTSPSCHEVRNAANYWAAQ